MEGPAKGSAVSGFSTDDLAMSLVREFLHRGGLERTLACLDEERTEKGIGGGSGLTSRSSLRKAMGLERHAAKAKAKSEDNVTPTSLEVLVAVHMQRVEKQLQLTGDGRHASSSSSSSSGPSVAERNADVLRSSASLDGGRKLQRPMTAHSGFSRSRSSFADTSSHRSGGAGYAHAAADVMVIEDLDDDTLGEDAAGDLFGSTAAGMSHLSLAGGLALSSPTPQGEPVHHEVWRQATLLLSSSGGLGGVSLDSAARCVPESWLQGFFFRERPDDGEDLNRAVLPYGLVQTEGGPCGVLAAVQSHMIKEHFKLRNLELAGAESGAGWPSLGCISKSQAQELLVRALASMLWQIGSARGSNGAGVLLPTSAGSLTWMAADTTEDLQRLLRGAMATIGMPKGNGLVAFVMSAILCRGPKAVERDMDSMSGAAGEGQGRLIGAHGYCTQELVNLLISGRAVSNVFDGVKLLEGGEGSSDDSCATELRGITGASEVGFLTLFEWYKYIEVGSYYKKPSCPVWVVCSESHFSTLFLHTDALSSSTRVPDSITETSDVLHLAYYDGLASQEQEIVLSLRYDHDGGHTGRCSGDDMGSRAKAVDSSGQPVPPLEYVIETRWPGVSIDWNGSEKIL